MSKQIKTPFDEYQIFYWSPQKAKSQKNSITVELKYNNTRVGTIYFYPDDYSPLPGDSVYVGSKGNKVILSFLVSQYEHILDLLRNESPLWISILANVGSTYGLYYGTGEITTGEEPVGEEET